MRTDEEIIQLLEARRSLLTRTQRMQRNIQDAYHGDLVVPLPELDKIDRSTVANVINLGIDGTSQRVASLMPVAKFYPDSSTGTARHRARMRRDIVRYWWEDERVQLKMGRLARHYSGYAQAILTLIPGTENRACWTVHDPLCAFPAECAPEQFVPENIIFERTYTAGWLRSYYPQLQLQLPPRDQLKDTTECKIVEYLDRDERVLLASYSYSAGYGSTANGSARIMRAPIELDRCPCVIAQRPGLARPAGQMDGVVGAYFAQNILQALEIIATKKSVFPDLWFIGQNGQPPRIISQADGLRGETGEVTDAQPWTDNRQPSQVGPQAIDRLERNMRVSGRVPAEYGGESGSNIRTGRRGDAVLSATIDLSVKEAQDAFAPFLYEADLIAIEYDRHWYGQAKPLLLRTGTTVKTESYLADDLWDGKEKHWVEYAYAGADANGLPISLGQRLGLETISKRTAMVLDPFVTDPEMEHDQIQAEQLEAALMQSISQQAIAGNIPPHFVAAIMRLVAQDDMELADAVDQVQQQAQQAQATPPAGPTDPNAQPGIANPGTGAESALEVQPPPGGLGNLSQLMRQLRLPNKGNVGVG